MIRLCLLLCLALVAQGQLQARAVLTAEEYLNDPDAFFTGKSTPYLEKEGDDVVLKLTTPLPVLCGVHYLPTSETDNMTAEWFVKTMDMTEPAEIHSVTLSDLDPANGEYKLGLTAFLPGPSQAVLLSATYTTDPSISPPSLSEELTGASTPLQQDPCTYELQVSETSVGSATLELSEQPALPVVYSIGRASADEASSTYELSRESTTTSVAAPNLSLQGLEADTSYFVEGCFVDTKRDVCCTPTASFMTQAQEGSDSSSCLGPNVALLDQGAVVNDVSSNWSNQDNDGSFGANKAIDGRSASAWSSDADGNDAWIEIMLPEPRQIAGVGVWSRTMGTSSEIKTFQLTLSDSSSSMMPETAEGRVAHVIGPLELEDTTQLYMFDITDQYSGDGEIPKVDLIRLDVLTSTEFNTGLRTFEVYPLLEGCGDGTSTTEPTMGPTTEPTMTPTTEDPQSGGPVDSPEPTLNPTTEDPQSGAPVDSPATDSPTKSPTSDDLQAGPLDPPTPSPTDDSSSGVRASGRYVATLVLVLFAFFLW